MATLLKVLNNLADIKSAGGVALRVRTQGSEYPAVIIPVLIQHYAMLQRNLLYTGVTRGKRLVVLVGQKKAIAIAVRNVSGRRRWSKLDEWLRLSTPSRSSNLSKVD